MAKRTRPLRVADRIQREVSEIIQRRFKDPRLPFLTVTSVSVSDDLKTAKIFVSTLDLNKIDDAIQLLDGAKGFIRGELGQRLTMRFTPEIIFKGDLSAAHAQRVGEILDKIHRETPATESKEKNQGGDDSEVDS